MGKLLLMALAIAILIFGCTGGEPQPGGKEQPAATAGGEQPSSTAPAMPADSQKGQGASALDPMGEFSRLIGMAGKNEWKVAYEIRSSTGGASTLSEMTQFAKGLDKIRIDTEANGQTIRSYMLSGKLYMCTKDKGAQWSCLDLSAEQEGSREQPGEIPGITQGRADANLEQYKQYNIQYDGTMEVAGVIAPCFKITGISNTSVRYCFSMEGVPLYSLISTSAGGMKVEQEMKAKSYTKSVSDSDFVLPAEPQAFNLPAPPSGAQGNVCSYCDYLSGDEKSQCLSSCSSG